jgi:abhydrolase domain-containing protein 17
VLKPVLLVLLLVYAAAAAIAYFLADRLIFLPPRSSYAPGELPVVHLPSEDGASIAVLHLRSDSATHTLLFSHGNAEDLGHIAPLLARLRDRVGVSVVGYDYRGYGLSAGAPPTAHGAIRDIDAVYHHLTRELGIPPERLIVHGRSVGSGPALDLAARAPVGGVIVESAFTSTFRVVTRIPLLPFDRFPNLRNLRHVRVPVLVVHGERDEVIPVSHGRRLFAAAPERKRHLWVEGAGHNDLVPVAGDEYWEAIRSFIRAVVGDRGRDE